MQLVRINCIFNCCDVLLAVLLAQLSLVISDILNGNISLLMHIGNYQTQQTNQRSASAQSDGRTSDREHAVARERSRSRERPSESRDRNRPRDERGQVIINLRLS